MAALTLLAALTMALTSRWWPSITEEPRIANQDVFVEGTIAYRQLADIVEEVRGTPVTRTEWSLPYELE